MLNVAVDCNLNEADSIQPQRDKKMKTSHVTHTNEPIEQAVSRVIDYICDDLWRQVTVDEMQGILTNLKQKSVWGRKGVVIS